MGGLMSRRKGIRIEYLVRDYFRSLGYKADRVPSSGAAEGFKGDVQVTRPGRDPFLVEVKARQGVFDRIYRAYHSHKDENGTLRFNLGGKLVAMGSDFLDVDRGTLTDFPVFDDKPRIIRMTFKSILNLARFLKGTQYLVIKRNHGILLFLKFWG